MYAWMDIDVYFSFFFFFFSLLVIAVVEGERMESEAHTIRECGGKTEDGGGGIPSMEPRTVPCVGEVAGDDPKYTWFRRNSGFQFPLGWMQVS